MLVFEDINSFAKQIMRYAGNGYKYIQISKISQAKLKKINKIDEKITKKYNTNLTTWQRQYKRRKGFANFVSLRYKSTIVILKTDGNTTIGEESFKPVLGSELEFDYLKLILFKDERGKMTYRMNRDIMRDIKTRLALTVKQKNGRKFHEQMKRLLTLSRVLPYRGINLQISSILKHIKEQQKKHSTKFEVPRFFK